MASVYHQLGTTLTWTSSGGDYTMTMSSLASGAGRAGGEVDFGSSYRRKYLVTAQFDFGSAPTAGYLMGLYLARSINGTNYDGEVSGSDAAWTDEQALKRMQFIGYFVCSNDTNIQQASWEVEIEARYGVPVVWNASGQTLTATGTDQIVTMTPIIEMVQ